MGKADNEENGYDTEEMTVELELDDGTTVNCAIVTILTVNKQDYIVLLPLDENDENTDGEVWFYRYREIPMTPTKNRSLAISTMTMNTKLSQTHLTSILTQKNLMNW